MKFNAEMRVQVTDGRHQLQAEKIEGVPDALAKFVVVHDPRSREAAVRREGHRSEDVADGLEFAAERLYAPLRG